MTCTIKNIIKGVREQRPLYLIVVQVDEEFEYEHGDLLDITCPEHPLRNRQYSIAGQPGKNLLELVVRDAGVVGSYLCSSIIGGSFEAEYIGGMFHPQPDSIYIASGSGIAPFRSLLSHGNSAGSSRYYLNVDSLEGVDAEEAIIGPTGDVYSVFTDSFDMQTATIADDSRLFANDRVVYVCGSSRYVTEMCSFLAEKVGVDTLRIQTDMYGAAVD